MRNLASVAEAVQPATHGPLEEAGTQPEHSPADEQAGGAHGGVQPAEEIPMAEGLGDSHANAGPGPHSDQACPPLQALPWHPYLPGKHQPSSQVGCAQQPMPPAWQKTLAKEVASSAKRQPPTIADVRLGYFPLPRQRSTQPLQAQLRSQVAAAAALWALAPPTAQHHGKQQHGGAAPPALRLQCFFCGKLGRGTSLCSCSAGPAQRRSSSADSRLYSDSNEQGM